MSAKLNLQGFLDDIASDVKKEVDWSFAIADKIESILQKENISHKEFARRMGKSEAEVSRWVSGTHNFTLRTIAKISAVIGEDLIRV